jgi:hypothetical protein
MECGFLPKWRRNTADLSARYQTPIHKHLVETACQKKYARRRGGTARDYIDRFHSGRG